MGTLTVPAHMDGTPVGSLQDDLAYFMRRRGFDNANELAEEADLSWPAVADILSGKTTRPRKETLEKLAEALGLSVQILEESAAQSAYGVESLRVDPDVQTIRNALESIEDPGEREAFVTLMVQMAKRFTRDQ